MDQRERIPILEVKELTKVYGAADNITKAFRGINITIDPGEHVVVMDPIHCWGNR